jgi:galactokinase
MKPDKRFQGSKKKARRRAYVEREGKRSLKMLHRVAFEKARKDGDLETMANLMGVRLT